MHGGKVKLSCKEDALRPDRVSFTSFASELHNGPPGSLLVGAGVGVGVVGARVGVGVVGEGFKRARAAGGLLLG